MKDITEGSAIPPKCVRNKLQTGKHNPNFKQDYEAMKQDLNRIFQMERATPKFV